MRKCLPIDDRLFLPCGVEGVVGDLWCVRGEWQKTAYQPLGTYDPSFAPWTGLQTPLEPSMQQLSRFLQ